MTEDELKKLLDGEELTRRLDIRSLVVDLISKQTSTEELLEIFKTRLPELDEAYVKRFTYMKRK